MSQADETSRYQADKREAEEEATEPAFRYNAKASQEIELKWQDY